jgi:hypothetical protein
MTYALVHPAEQTDGEASALIVALERLDALSKILGKTDIVAKVQGLWIQKSFRQHYAHLYI